MHPLVLAWFGSFSKTCFKKYLGINPCKLVLCDMVLVEKFLLLNSDFNQYGVFTLGPGAECTANAFCI